MHGAVKFIVALIVIRFIFKMQSLYYKFSLSFNIVSSDIYYYFSFTYIIIDSLLIIFFIILLNIIDFRALYL